MIAAVVLVLAVAGGGAVLFLGGDDADSTPSPEAAEGPSGAAAEQTPAQPAAEDPPSPEQQGSQAPPDEKPLATAEEPPGEPEPVADEAGVPPYQLTTPGCARSSAAGALRGEQLARTLERVRDGNVPMRPWEVFAASCEMTRAEIAIAFNRGGLIAHRERDFARAVELWERTVSIDPSTLSARYNLACGYALLGRPEDAIEQLTEVSRGGAEGNHWLGRARDDDDFSSLRGNAKFHQLVGS